MATPHRLMTIEEYLALEEASDVKHEYVDGELHAFAGANRHHNRIVANVARLLLNAAVNGPCDVLIADMKVRAPLTRFYYPDIVVVCDSTDTDNLIVERPCYIVEVLSPSTEAIDRREKAAAYRGITSLQGMTLVSSEERRVAHYWRDDHGNWQRTDVIGDGMLRIPCPATELTLADIYRNVVDGVTPPPDERR